ncbi:hypothetical protein [Citreimonas salinaria]|uniref:hypothetical protein n=1 Tax=Citreimonas salinaria TaxID=321339 RepID=UPI00115FE2EF|nr:hypothetical protein [Citreimonas salinaria]
MNDKRMRGTDLRSLLAAAVLAVSFSAADAEETPHVLGADLTLGAVNYSNIAVLDQVNDGCWTNSSNTSARVRLLLEQSDIAVVEGGYFTTLFAPTVELNANGFRAGAVCAVSATFKVSYPGYVGYGGTTAPRYYFSAGVTLFESSAIFTNGRDVNAQLADYYTAQASDFASRVISARRSSEIKGFFESYPMFSDAPLRLE